MILCLCWSVCWQVIKHESKDASQRLGPKRARNTEVPCDKGEFGGGCQDYSTNVLVRQDNPFVKVCYALVPGLCSQWATGDLECCWLHQNASIK